VFEPMDPSADAGLLRSVSGVREIRTKENLWEVILDEDAAPASVLSSIIQSVMPMQFKVQRPSLEDIFVDIVSGAGQGKGDESLREALREGAGTREARL